MMAASDGQRPTWWGLGRILVVGAAGALLAAGVHPPEVALPGVDVTAPSAAVADLFQESRLVCAGIEVRGHGRHFRGGQEQGREYGEPRDGVAHRLNLGM